MKAGKIVHHEEPEEGKGKVHFIDGDKAHFLAQRKKP